MGIKLKRDVKPDTTSDTSFDELVVIAETTDPIAHSTGRYGTSNQHSNPLSNTVTQLRLKDTRNDPLGHDQPFSNNTSQYNNLPPREK